MANPALQSAIRLTDFIVTKVTFEVGRTIDRNITEALQIGVDLSLAFSEENKKSYTVKFKIDLANESKDFNLDIVAVAFFETITDMDDDFKNSNFIKVNSPAIAFPFVRSYINTITTNSGFSPILLPAFNFAQTDVPKEPSKAKL